MLEGERSEGFFPEALLRNRSGQAQCRAVPLERATPPVMGYPLRQAPLFSRVAVLISLILSVVSCGDGPTDPATHTASVRAVLGAGITDTVDAQPVQALVVEVRGSGGALAPTGTLVRFEALPVSPGPGYSTFQPAVYLCELTATACGVSEYGFGAPQVSSETTDDRGRVKVLVRLGLLAGRGVVRLTVPELGLLDSATYTILPGAPAAVRAGVGDTNLDIGGTLKLTALVVDRHENIRTEQATFTAGPGSAISFDAATATATGRDMGTQWVFSRFQTLVDSTRIQVIPSGRLVVWANGEGVVQLVNLDGTSERTIASNVASDLGAFPSFDVSRQYVTFHDGSEGWGGAPNTVIVADTAGGSTRTIGPTTGFSYVVGTREMADGTILVAGQSSTDTSHPGYSLWRVATDNTISFVVSLPGLGNSYGGVDISHSGTKVAYIGSGASSGYELHVLNVSDGSSVTIENNARAPRWSAHDDLLARIIPTSFNGFDPDYNGPVVISNPDGSGRRALGTASFSLGIGWSPDGAYIVGRASEGYALRLLRVSDLATIVLRFTSAGGLIHDYWQPDWR